MPRPSGCAWLLGLALAGCVAPDPGPPARQAWGVPSPAGPATWGPRRDAGIEWWYVGGTSPAADLVFHVAVFEAQAPREARWLGLPLRRLFPRRATLVTVAVTDTTTGERWVREASDAPLGGCCAASEPLRLGLHDLTLRAGPTPGTLAIEAGPLRLTLETLTPEVVHPPGWTGSAELGRYAYQSRTRLAWQGTWRGREARGLAWMDHQWGDPWPGRDVRWDWHGLHLDDGTDLMLFDMTRPDGSARTLHGTRTFPDGRVEALVGLRLVPQGIERVPGGTPYALRWQVAAEGLDLVLTPTRLDQEVASRAGVRYWEGAVRAAGTLDGRPVAGLGLGEHLPWPWGGTVGACASTTSPAR